MTNPRSNAAECSPQHALVSEVFALATRRRPGRTVALSLTGHP